MTDPNTTDALTVLIDAFVERDGFGFTYARVWQALHAPLLSHKSIEPLVFDDWFDKVYMPTRLERDRVAERHAAIAGWVAAHDRWENSLDAKRYQIVRARSALASRGTFHNPAEYDRYIDSAAAALNPQPEEDKARVRNAPDEPRLSCALCGGSGAEVGCDACSSTGWIAVNETSNKREL